MSNIAIACVVVPWLIIGSLISSTLYYLGEYNNLPDDGAREFIAIVGAIGWPIMLCIRTGKVIATRIQDAEKTKVAAKVVAGPVVPPQEVRNG